MATATVPHSPSNVPRDAGVNSPPPEPPEPDQAEEDRPSRLGTVLPVALSFAILASIALAGMGAGAAIIEAALRFLGAR